jgi:hypothetical protein
MLVFRECNDYPFPIVSAGVIRINMHKTLLLFGFPSFFLVSSCKKDSLHSETTRIIGSWELRDFQGGTGPVNSSDVTPGNGNIYKFSGSTYQFYS